MDPALVALLVRFGPQIVEALLPVVVKLVPVVVAKLADGAATGDVSGEIGAHLDERFGGPADPEAGNAG